MTEPVMRARRFSPLTPLFSLSLLVSHLTRSLILRTRYSRRHSSFSSLVVVPPPSLRDGYSDRRMWSLRRHEVVTAAPELSSVAASTGSPRTPLSDRTFQAELLQCNLPSSASRHALSAARRVPSLPVPVDGLRSAPVQLRRLSLHRLVPAAVRGGEGRQRRRGWSHLLRLLLRHLPGGAGDGRRHSPLRLPPHAAGAACCWRPQRCCAIRCPSWWTARGSSSQS